MDISTNAAGDIEQLAFILLSVISKTLLGVHPPLWKFLPLELQILSALVKFVPMYQKIAEFTDISTNAAGEIKQLAFTLISGINRTLLGVHGNFSLSLSNGKSIIQIM